MAIDQATLKRDAQAVIADWPVQARYKGKLLTVRIYNSGTMGMILEGGILDDATITVTAIADDFGKRPPEPFELFEFQQRDGKWRKFSIKDVPNRFDPLTPTYTLILNTEEK